MSLSEEWELYVGMRSSKSKNLPYAKKLDVDKSECEGAWCQRAIGAVGTRIWPSDVSWALCYGCINLLAFAIQPILILWTALVCGLWSIVRYELYTRWVVVSELVTRSVTALTDLSFITRRPQIWTEIRRKGFHFRDAIASVIRTWRTRLLARFSMSTKRTLTWFFKPIHGSSNVAAEMNPRVKSRLSSGSSPVLEWATVPSERNRRHRKNGRRRGESVMRISTTSPRWKE